MSAASPERTYALVVGVERYDAGPDWNLDGPASDATRFVSWLSERGVPADQMAVFLSPLNQTPPLPPGVMAEPARREQVTEAITRTLPGWRGDLLWLFWAGHGVLTRDDHIRLFYADASTEDKRNLDLPSLLTTLRSDRYPSFPRQVGLVDACQTYADRLQFATTLPTDTFSYGQPLPGREQFVMYAASAGQLAANLGGARAGLFSQVVMEELAKADHDDWPPGMDLVATQVDRRFTQLRAAGHAEQTPTSFRWRPWTGGERILGETPPEPTAAASPPVRRPPSALAMRELVDRLLDVEVVADPLSRAAIVRRLRKGLATSIRHDAAARVHVVNIVTRCLDFPGGLAELMEAVRLYADPRDPALGDAEPAARRLAAETGQEGWTT
jgi:hypothetical protein